MTYFTFLAIFVLIPILIFGASMAWQISRRASAPSRPFHLEPRPVLWGIFAHVVLAVVYTTPWDNYLVATGVWYYNPKLVTGIVLGYVPIEEYTFFVVETILSGLVWWHLAKAIPPTKTSEQPAPNWRFNIIAVIVVAAFWVFFTRQFFSGPEAWTYLSIIYFWALPPILLQLAFGADLLWQHRKLVFLAIALPGTYLSLTDIIALRATTWQISPTQTLGLNLFGILPIEEITFFFITNVLIVFGLTLLLSTQGAGRLQAIQALLRRKK